jgi:hypothetical protein
VQRAPARDDSVQQPGNAEERAAISEEGTPRGAMLGALMKPERTEPIPPLAATSMLQVGDSLSLTVGPDTYFPIKFNGFTVGPIAASTKVRDGENGADAWLRLHRFVDELFAAEFEIRKVEYFRNLQTVGAEAEGRKA